MTGQPSGPANERGPHELGGAAGGGRRCARCGSAGTGNFCSRCGAPVAARAGCPSCGARIRAGALYCSECGAAVGSRPGKSTAARAPWIVSGLALAAFSVLIAVLVQRGSVDRVGDMTMTGGLPGEAAGGGAAGGAAGTAGGTMPSMEELANMTPREVADRLFERVMREHEGGDFERAAFFVEMALQAYDAVPEDSVDQDLHFHTGLLRLLAADSTGARRDAETILGAEPDHLLGLLLAARAAELAGDTQTAQSRRARMRTAVEAADGIPSRPEYDAHRTLIEGAVTQAEAEAEATPGTGGSGP